MCTNLTGMTRCRCALKALLLCKAVCLAFPFLELTLTVCSVSTKRPPLLRIDVRLPSRVLAVNNLQYVHNSLITRVVTVGFQLIQRPETTNTLAATRKLGTLSRSARYM